MFFHVNFNPALISFDRRGVLFIVGRQGMMTAVGRRGCCYCRQERLPLPPAWGTFLCCCCRQEGALRVIDGRDPCSPLVRQGDNGAAFYFYALEQGTIDAHKGNKHKATLYSSTLFRVPASKRRRDSIKDKLCHAPRSL